MRIVRQFIPDPAAQLRALDRLLQEPPRVSEDERTEDQLVPDPVELRPETDDAA